MPAEFPRRIVCLSDETTETLYLLGEQDRIVGVSGFTTRPPEARLKPRVSAFSSANFDSILKLAPDLVLTFSDVQAEITRELVLRGITVFNFNQRSVEEIFDMVTALSPGRSARAWSGACRRTAARSRTNCGVRGGLPLPAARFFRRMEGAANQRHSLGGGID